MEISTFLYGKCIQSRLNQKIKSPLDSKRIEVRRKTKECDLKWKQNH
jgi:hypothetical protein